MKYVIRFGQETIAEICHSDDLVRVLTSVKDNFRIANPLLELIYSTKNRLFIGVSKSNCWLHYVNEDKGYFLPVNSNADDGNTYFMLGTHHTEVKLKNCMSFNELLVAAGEYLQHGELPESLEWEEFK